jgi:hypothetical protein
MSILLLVRDILVFSLVIVILFTIYKWILLKWKRQLSPPVNITVQGVKIDDSKNVIIQFSNIRKCAVKVTLESKDNVETIFDKEIEPDYYSLKLFNSVDKPEWLGQFVKVTVDKESIERKIMF